MAVSLSTTSASAPDSDVVTSEFPLWSVYLDPRITMCQKRLHVLLAQITLIIINPTYLKQMSYRKIKFKHYLIFSLSFIEKDKISNLF